jgi:hypothetical protein
MGNLAGLSQFGESSSYHASNLYDPEAVIEALRKTYQIEAMR